MRRGVLEASVVSVILTPSDERGKETMLGMVPFAPLRVTRQPVR